MNLSSFDYPLPEHLIARYPLENRTQSRLLHLTSEGQRYHRSFSDLSKMLNPHDILVFNNTRVIPARLMGRKMTGGKIEVLIERILSPQTALAHLKTSKPLKVGATFYLDGNQRAVNFLGRTDEGLYHLHFQGDESISDYLEAHGQIPLPPYFNREQAALDKDRYQTVYAEIEGAVAAPTAGLHFDEALMAYLKSHFSIGFVTLHVGAGTFKPVQVEDIEKHVMHQEWLQVSSTLCQQIAQAKALGGRVIAIGTTTARALETAARGGELKPYSGWTDIFIREGFEFRVVDALLTNFHLPASTLLMLVCAFNTQKAVLDAYHEAIVQEYRFFSYGDAMMIERAEHPF